MAGQLARALQRTDFSGKIGNLLQRMQEQEKEKQNKEDMANLLKSFQQTQGNLGQIASGQDPNMTRVMPAQDVQPQSTVPNNLEGALSNLDIAPQVNPRQVQSGVLADNLSPQDQYRMGQAETNKFITGNLFNENVDPQKLGVIAKILQSQTEGMKPAAPKIVERDPAKTYIAIDKNGKEKVIQQGAPKTKESKVGSYTGADGYQYTTYKNADGTIETIKSENRVKDTGNNKEALKKAETEKLNQTKYNAIMGSPFLKIDDLLTQGLITEEEVDTLTKLTPEGEVEGYKQGGAYVVRNKDGSPKLIFTNKLLENYAKSQIPGAPNKWTRLKKDKKEQAKSKAVDTKTDDNDPLGLR